MGLDADIQMMILLGFLYLVLPVLACTALGATIGSRSPAVGKLRGICLGLGIGSLGILANAAYAFLASVVWEWMYPSSIRLSETRVAFPFYSTYHIRDAIYLSGPCFLAVVYTSTLLLTFRLWKRTPLVYLDAQ